MKRCFLQGPCHANPQIVSKPQVQLEFHIQRSSSCLCGGKRGLGQSTRAGYQNILKILCIFCSIYFLEYCSIINIEVYLRHTRSALCILDFSLVYTGPTSPGNHRAMPPKFGQNIGFKSE